MTIMRFSASVHPSARPYFHLFIRQAPHAILNGSNLTNILRSSNPTKRRLIERNIDHRNGKMHRHSETRWLHRSTDAHTLPSGHKFQLLLSVSMRNFGLRKREVCFSSRSEHLFEATRAPLVHDTMTQCSIPWTIDCRAVFGRCYLTGQSFYLFIFLLLWGRCARSLAFRHCTLISIHDTC